MSLLLTLEHGPRAQARQQAKLDEGEMVIGRSASADWQIDDPDMYVSRAHCTISADGDGYFVTDTSSSGLFIDDSVEPLGTGNTAQLRSGMRLRLGEYIIWADVQSRTGASAPAAPASLGGDDFFSARTEEEPKPQRPAGLPDPFDNQGFGGSAAPEPERPRSQAFDDPFSLDPLPTPAPAPSAPETGPFADFADTAGSRHGSAASTQDAWDDFPAAPAPPAPAAPQPTPPPPSFPAGEAAPRRPAPAAPAPVSDDALRAAFLRGLGLDPSDTPGHDPVAEMEKFGREYRLMMEGLMQLLRKRAEEKSNARVAQTVVGASEVNPLKFLPTVEDALAMIASERSPGFLPGEAAIADAVRDLAEHHVRAWRGVQTALRRMIDRFDPASIEEELKSSSAVGTLLSGGRGAKLWELYSKRHREISMNAESRFLGDVGADFRNAYEEE